MNNINVLKRNGKKVPLDIIKIRQTLEKAGEDIEGIDILEVERDSHLVFTEGITTNEIQTTLKKTVNDKIRVESPNYTYLGARLELQSLIKDAGRRNKYKPLKEVVEKAVEEGIYINDLLEYDLNLLDYFIDISRDNLYTYNGIITFKDRYAKYNKQGTLIEMPQHFFMRIAMAVCVKDFDKDWLPEELIQDVVKKNPLLSIENVYRHCWVIEMYNAYSKFELSGSTPILANAGTPYGMLIACFVGTVGDTLKSRVRSDANFAECSSYGGGVGDDITDLRCNGSSLRNFVSGANGVVPFIKTAHGYTMQYNQAGTRNGSRAISIVPYHWDLFDFIELKKQSGDEARRVKGKGIYPELFIPDLFFKRILAGEEWTLFDPKDVAILNTVWGEEFERLYIEFEQNKHIKKKSYDAYDVFKKIIQSLDGTGAPFILYRDNFNRRNPQAHDGIIKSSQLCVSGDTKILTKQGNIPIERLVGKTIECWNGEEWSDTLIEKTSDGQKVLEILFNNQEIVRATPYHKWEVVLDNGKKIEKTTAELLPNDKISKLNTVVCEHGIKELPLAYENGFFTGDGTYQNNTTCRISLYSTEKKELLKTKFKGYERYLVDGSNRINVVFNRSNMREKFFIPDSSYRLEDRLEWLAGVLDSDGCMIKFNDSYGLQLSMIELDFMKELRLMLLELGVTTNLAILRDAGYNILPMNDGSGESKPYPTKTLYRLCISNDDICHLFDLGLVLNRINLNKNMVRYSNYGGKRCVKVVEVVDRGEIIPTYCGNEPKLHKLVFNGILGFQCVEIGVVAKPTTFIGWELDADGNAIEKWNLGKTNICCLASVNLARVNEENVERVTRLGVRMLDNVITINKYVTPETYKAGMEDRNIGLGVMGETEALAQRGIYFGTLEHSNYIDDVYQAMDYYSIQTSSDLAVSRGKYKTYEGSSWSQGILTAELGTGFTLEDTDRFKWSELRAKVKKDGMRNANLTAIAPTGTISVHLGTTPCIEPVYKRRYMEEAKNGDMIAVTAPSISINNYQQYQPAEEINQELVLRMAAKRQKWLTQSQSLNLFKPLDGDFDDMMGLYILAWQLGLKSTYYLKNRSKLSASFEDKKESNIACAGCD